jgi:hypothetical protein
MSRPKTMLWLVGSLLVGSLLLGACGDETLRPAPVEGTGGSGATGGVATTGSSGGGGTQATVRTIIERDPLGNVQKSQNLLWDGDFEWRPSFQDQYGWLYGPSIQQLSFAMPPLGMGAECHSGIKCARLPTDGLLLGLSVASEGKSLAIEVWSKPESGACNDLVVFLIAQEGSESDLEIAATTAEPDGEGWCRHAALVPARATAQYLFIQASSPTVVDDASIEPAEGQADYGWSRMLSKADAERARAWGRAAQLPRIPPPSKAKRKLREHLRRLSRIRR